MPYYLENEILDVFTISLHNYWPNLVYLLAEEQAVRNMA
jgi:hypothetical protein